MEARASEDSARALVAEGCAVREGQTVRGQKTDIALVRYDAACKPLAEAQAGGVLTGLG